jgi:bifunctional DNA-binding transcriptional regulator/antitoxin component of YhaV-PrlF toxin-antitoxin module
MEVTTLSTRGQIVIPERLRSEYAVGCSFVVTKVNDLLVLKPVVGLTIAEQKELKELNKLWAEIDTGKSTKLSESEFFKALRQW